MEFDIISDSKIILERFSHSLSGLEPMFNNFISLNLFFRGDRAFVRSEIRESILIPPVLLVVADFECDAYCLSACLGIPGIKSG